MANNVTLPGTGAPVASDDIGGVHYQRVKLMDGTEDSAAVIPGGVNGLLVSLGTLLSGEDTTNNRLLTDVKPATTDSVQELLQNAAAATGVGVAINLKGYRSATLDITGTFVATITFEGTIDDTNWFVLALTPSTRAAAASTATTVGAWLLPQDVALSQLRARVSAFTSGTITVRSRKHPR